MQLKATYTTRATNATIVIRRSEPRRTPGPPCSNDKTEVFHPPFADDQPSRQYIGGNKWCKTHIQPSHIFVRHTHLTFLRNTQTNTQWAKWTRCEVIKTLWKFSGLVFTVKFCLRMPVRIFADCNDIWVENTMRWESWWEGTKWECTNKTRHISWNNLLGKFLRWRWWTSDVPNVHIELSLKFIRIPYWGKSDRDVLANICS